MKTDDGISKNVKTAKLVASALSKDLGFVNRAALIESDKRGELFSIQKKGFVHFHMRLDGQFTIYEIGVHPSHQGKGIGAKLIFTAIAKAKSVGESFICLKCPIDLKSNSFYQKQGFELVDTIKGRVRQLNVWVMVL